MVAAHVVAQNVRSSAGVIAVTAPDDRSLLRVEWTVVQPMPSQAARRSVLPAAQLARDVDETCEEKKAKITNENNRACVKLKIAKKCCRKRQNKTLIKL